MLKVLRKLTPGQWGKVCAAIVFIVIQVWLDLTLPDYMSTITTLVETPGSDMVEILANGGWMLACALGSALASVVTGYFAAQVAAGLSKTLRHDVFDHVLDLSKGDVDGFSTASLINRTTSDITQIQMLVSMGLQAIVKAPIEVIWAVSKIMGKGWEWSAATGVGCLAIVVMLTIALVFAVPRFTRIQSISDTINRLVREHLEGIRPVRAYNAEAYEQSRFEEANDDITQTNLVAQRVMALMSPGMTLVSSGLTLAIYWIGAYLIVAAVSAGAKLQVFSDMVVFINYAMQVVMAFVLLNMVFILLPRAQVSARRVMGVLDCEPSIEDGVGAGETGGTAETPAAKPGTIEFRDVSFHYPNAGADVLQHVSFTVQPGQYVAIIGVTGSGKTSLVQLVNRMYDVTGGKVLVDGHDVREYAQDDLRRKIGYVPQKANLMSGTIGTNVCYGDAGHPITAADANEAIDIAQSGDFVEAMGGQDATIEQGGRNVSGGQRQRLAIARAVARKPEALVFDDSFSALDFRTDRALRAALREKCAGTTQVVVAQRIGTIRGADQIVVLDHGRVAGIGTHDELLRSCEVYQEIAQSQLSKEELENA